MSIDIKNLGSFVWSIAETLRGDFKQSEYGKVILPFVVLRRLDCILESTKPAVLDLAGTLPDDIDDEARDALLSGVVGQNIKLYNLSRFAFASSRKLPPQRPLEGVSLKTALPGRVHGGVHVHRCGCSLFGILDVAGLAPARQCDRLRIP